MTSTTSQYRIITVCTGNICRSPMAELMLAEAFAAEGLTGAAVDSAGTTAYEAGRPIDPRASRLLRAHGIASDQHVAREWRAEWFQGRELILALDVDHYGWLRQAAPDHASEAKIRMLRSFDPAVAGRDLLDQGIEDPWYGGHADFESTWELIRASIPGIVGHVRAQLQRLEGHRPGDTGQRVRLIS
ncbi:low molecular weight phosphotyrosine protein phosphatase [Arthrobacter sp. PAMC25564]|uniref:low molecular weight protein-tyrosine-phosphatase n=1 Tax=Arthrobacter sp. PAMC25564 TaxID=2565366 RepID=UPI0010A25218|nr:low molecular weight protein-tyrosine-phosphatase [Arthrobacter sp. PAMC25564]QCB96279.1 low molecular weight phosphotyrosine protein phosphatase [Arthrobacter sp. PAMC25564]